MSELATAEHDRPVFFPAGSDTLFGVHTSPTEHDRRVGIVLLQGGDTVNVSMHRNRLGVRMARELSELGYHTIRFDYHGLGESTGQIERLSLTQPFSADAVAAADYLRDQGLNDLILIGSCFGARTALAAAPLIDGVRAVLLASPPSAGYDRTDGQSEVLARSRSLGDYARSAIRPETVKSMWNDPKLRAHYLKLGRKKFDQIVTKIAGMLRRSDGLEWVSDNMLDPLEALVDAGVPVMFVYGTDDPLFDEFERARAGRLGRIIERSRGSVKVNAETPGVMHGFPSVSVQEAFAAIALTWIEETVPEASTDDSVS